MACDRDKCIMMLDAINDFASEYTGVCRSLLEALQSFYAKEQPDDAAAGMYYKVGKTIGEYGERTTEMTRWAHDRFLDFANASASPRIPIRSEGPEVIRAEKTEQPEETGSHRFSLEDAAVWAACGQVFYPAAKQAEHEANRLYACYSSLKNDIGGDAPAVTQLEDVLKNLCSLQEIFTREMRNATVFFKSHADMISAFGNRAQDQDGP